MMKKLLLTASCIWLAASFTAKAQTGGSLSFDGVDDYVQVDSAITPLLDSMVGLTVEAWVYPTTTANAGSIISDFQTGGGGDFHFLLRRDGDSYNFFTSDASNISYISTNSGTVQLNTWQHVCGTWDATTREMKLYLNGVLQSSMLSNTYSMGSTPDPVWIGNNNMGHSFEGRIDEVRLWNRALCDAEVPFRMNCEITGPAYGLLINYHFNEGDAGQANAGVTNLLNDAGNGSVYDATLYNFALNGTSSNWVAPGAVAAGVSCGAFSQPFSVSVSATNALCYELTGSVTATPSVGGNYDYNWAPSPYAGQGTATMNGYAGTYTCTVTNACSATATATATITGPPRISYIQSPVVAAGQSFTVGANMYTVSGTYTDTLTSMSGCDSIITTMLTVVRPEITTQSPVICQGDSVAAGNHYYSATGNYSDTLAAHMGYQTLFNFGGYNGENPYTGLLADSIWLYGTTGSAGPGGAGTLFKIKENGTGHTILHAFSNGETPAFLGKPYYDGTWLYAMVSGNGGYIYKIKPDGSSFTILYNFAEITGWYPAGSLISDGTFFYGSCQVGGPNDAGGVFKIAMDGTGFTMLTNLAPGMGTGVNPAASPVFDGTWLYATTQEEFSGIKGAVFKMRTDGSDFTVLHQFSGLDGRSAKHIYYDGAALYGSTVAGGAGNNGTIYKINTDGSGFATLHSFNGANGTFPQVDLISDGTALYGVVSQGASGYVFSMMKDGSNFTTVTDLSTAGLGSPYSLVQHNGAFYGMTNLGGAGNAGAIFKYRFTGTDSIVSTNLTVNQPTTSALSFTLCPNDAVQVGTHYYSTAGTYTDILINAAGCDSIITTQVAIMAVNDTIVLNDGTFTALQSGATFYQWYDCDTDDPIVGDTNQTFTPSYNGQFYVEFIYNGCDIYSDCMEINNVGIRQQEEHNAVKVFPNPSTGLFTVSLEKEAGIRITNALGAVVLEKEMKAGNNSIDLGNEASGVYFMTIKAEGRVQMIKLVKQN
jgi:uncharacterized repeat protein (TIGR03803 family)